MPSVADIIKLLYEGAVLLQRALAGKEDSARVKELQDAIAHMKASFDAADKEAKERLNP